MAVSLQKGQRVNLSKDGAGLAKIMVGLGWDQAKQSSGKKGILGGLLGKSGSEEIDCDASVFLLGANDKFEAKENLIYFGNLTSKCGNVVHQGDNLTGEGEGDDEQIMIDLSNMPESVHKLSFVVTIYNCKQRKQHFGMIENAFIRVVNLSGNNDLVRFDLAEEYSGKTSLIVAEIYRHGNEWKFAAVGQGSNATSLEELRKVFL